MPLLAIDAGKLGCGHLKFSKAKTTWQFSEGINNLYLLPLKTYSTIAFNEPARISEPEYAFDFLGSVKSLNECLL